ncbi:undecaprenyl-phosphate galactosephosphotransferase [Liquorilactobacillus sucicola DSM 21376 = JCM 15457]|uniref:Bacterial sugar transferase n=1 Tax=Liquorilactobacillus sucicola DSM 21376 = JCM 15457 TaxID=1423806 RepID=A0A023CWS7_9LACO|nr:exopolysaccharide biosynthesis polyprenyl glycosylphosphotransferase [Liquorilactobacillus sucicola]KRN06316.1 bacterial sugar transferase [Liquorilactobacillus sucicola DSM 21376 = JCM 15457]GAJ26259.1 undecaprenyl-phosphate galactosephosphotransferase [Liquorilactobacillus sucicola DSM 21376 = JCM 15457]
MNGKSSNCSGKFLGNIGFHIVQVSNLLLMTASFAFVWYVFYANKITAPLYNRNSLLFLLVFAVIYFLYGRIYDAFEVNISKVSELTYSQCLAALLSDGILYIMISLLAHRVISILPMVLCFFIQTVVALGWSTTANRIHKYLFPAKKTLVIYNERTELEKLKLNKKLRASFMMQRFLHVTDCENKLTQCFEGMDAVFLINIDSQRCNQIIKECAASNMAVYLLPRIGDVIMSSAEKMHMLHLPILRVSHYDPQPEYIILKKAFDLFSAGILLILTLPLFIVVAAAIKLDDRGPVFYKQNRLTQGGKVFKVLKFRSMRMDAEKDGVARLCTGDTDNRITPVGKFLRKVRLDELPQLINILKGEMSVVGPRPERPEIAKEYEKTLPEFSLRLQAKAGLTGYAQVYGKYNTSPYNKLEMDLMYIAKPRVLTDLKIIFATIKILFMSESTEGVSKEQAIVAGKANGR